MIRKILTTYVARLDEYLARSHRQPEGVSRADGYVATRLMCRLICNLPELSIRIFNPITSYFLIYRYVFRIADPYIRYSRIAYPAEH